MAKWIIGVVVVLGLGYWAWQSGMFGKSAQPAQPQEQQQAPTAPQAQAPKSGLPTADNDASDAAIAQDAAAVDGQVQALGTDSTAIDTSLNDKTVTQSY